MNIGTLTLRDRVFAVTLATLWGHVTTEADQWVCKWELNIETEERQFPGDDPEYPERWRPSAYVMHLRSPVRSWRELDGAVFVGEDEQLENLSLLRDETVFRLYVYEHAPVANNRLAFSNRDGHLFDLDGTGAAGVFADDDYSDGVPFRVRAKVRVMGVSMLLSTNDPEAPAPPVAEIFQSVLDPAAFRLLPTTETLEPSGHRRWHTEFVPV